MSRRASRILLVLAVAQTIAPSASGAQTSAEDATQLATAIRQAVLAIAPPDATISLGPLNGARYMQSCAGPLSVAISGTVPYEQAAAHCPNPEWTLYVTVTIAQSAKVVVAARPVTAGQSLGPADLTFAQEPVSLYAGRQVFHDTDQLIGASATMSLPTGTIVTSDNIAEPVVVKAGQTVSVSVISGGVNVSINAVADETGRIGDTILLTNPSSGRRFSALVTADGPVVQLQS
jgi:flagella basal body P-ring formation protein FlgA